MPLSHLVVAMPAYNEVEGIRGFIDEVRGQVAPLATRLTFVVADDRSTDGTPDALDGLADVRVERQPENRGHGPTALAAYRAGLALDPDVLVHVDGDGQFLGPDFVRLVTALLDERADVVHGVRSGRTDPWYRRLLTASVGTMIAFAAGRRIPDVNTPLRAYRPDPLRELVAAVPSGATVPHVHFSLAEARAGLVVRYLRVRSIPRRGESTSGTMWGDGPKLSLPPKRLRSFAGTALAELWSLSLRPGAPLRSIRLPSGSGR
ncbi:glycosyltransferase family 2 protein [Agromyces mediolanus]|uniref:glycosyltransferase family 2 protein n=1 Tax=Agromyces mediolanus TaxID=41986 RepID=UPI0038373A7B